MDLTLANYLKIRTSMTGEQPITLIIDTGADISIIKNHKINSHQVIYHNEYCNIKGITNEAVRSLGTTTTDLLLREYSCKHTFHLVSQNFPIPADGILGRDFFYKYKCIINYERNSLTIQFSDSILELPIYNGPQVGVITVPPRCEVWRSISNDLVKNDKVIKNSEIKPGVFIAGAIISKTSPYVKILNTTNEYVDIKNTCIPIDDLNEYNVYNIENESKNRNLRLREELSRDIPKCIKEEVTSLCEEFADVFGLKDDKITTNNFYSQKLKLSDNTPVYIKNYRIPKVQKDEIHRQINKMLDDQIIEPSTAEYNSPVLLVPKKSQNGIKKWRLVIDYRQLNKKLVGDKFPLPRLDDILDQLGRAKWFSVLDLVSGFHQIPLDEESRDVTTFSSESGAYRFTRLPFGLKVSPNSFQRMMTMAFTGLTPERAFLYMDDLIVIGCSEQHHLANLRKVFETCRKFNLKLNPEKCKFFRKEVTFLGHKVTDQGILPDENKYIIIQKYPTPRSAEEVKRFIAFCNYYRRFIPNFANIANPLNKLLKKNIKFVWTDQCQHSFEKLKNCLLHPTILQYPDFSKAFILTTDASKEACGAILSQKFGDNDLPIAYASKSFTKGEINKSTIEKELAAIHWAIKYFRPYLYGQKFIVRSDHKALIYLFSLKDPSSKLTRMRLDIEEYDFVIEYIKGKDNVGADALSRISVDELKEIHYKSVLAVTRSMTKTKLKSDIKNMTDCENEPIKFVSNFDMYDKNELNKLPFVQFVVQPTFIRIMVGKGKKIISEKIVKDGFGLDQILSQLEQMADDLNINEIKLSLLDPIFENFSINELKTIGLQILKKLIVKLYNENEPLIISNKEDKMRLMKQYHDNPAFGGHCGQKRLLKKLKAQFRWKNMSKDVARYVKSCIKCMTNKAKIKHKEEMILTPTPQKAFDIVCIDTIGPFVKTDQNNVYAVTLQCELTKYIVIIPIPNKEAKTVAKAITENFILIYGLMKEIRTDMGTEYKNEILHNLTRNLDIQHKFSTAYHSETIGGCERNHRVLNEYLRSYINDTGSNWDEWTSYYSFCYNTTPSTYHDYTPYELVFGKKVELPSTITTKVDPIYNIDAYENEIKYRLQVSHKRAKDYLDKVKMKRKIEYDKSINTLKINKGDLVLITNENRTKLDPWYVGPYVVLDSEGPNCILKANNGKQIKIHKNRIQVYKSITDLDN